LFRRIVSFRTKHCFHSTAIPLPDDVSKNWDDHVVQAEPGKQTILYADLQLVHEVTSPQAFEGCGWPAARSPARADRGDGGSQCPTTDRSLPIVDPISKKQIETLRENCREFGIRLYDVDDASRRRSVIGPELGSRSRHEIAAATATATHGAFGALAFGIGTSEVEHVLATQTLLQHKPKTFEIRIDAGCRRA